MMSFFYGMQFGSSENFLFNTRDGSFVMLWIQV